MMQQERAISLLARQVKDIQSQADKILGGNFDSGLIENFANYSKELQSFIEKNVESSEIKKLAKDFPNLNYKRNQVQIWHYILLPLWLISLYQDHIAKKKTIEEIYTLRGKYASLEFLIKSI